MRQQFYDLSDFSLEEIESFAGKYYEVFEEEMTPVFESLLALLLEQPSLEALQHTEALQEAAYARIEARTDLQFTCLDVRLPWLNIFTYIAQKRKEKAESIAHGTS